MLTEQREPGLHEGVSFEDYLAIDDALSNTSVGALLEYSPWHARHSVKEPTLATRYGTLFHIASLQPERFADMVTIGGPVNPRTGAEYGRDTKAWSEHVTANPGKVIMAREEADEFRAMLGALERHPIARQLVLDTPAHRECTIIWDQPVSLEDGAATVRHKCRPDILHRDAAVVVDLKTTGKPIAARRLAQHFMSYGYHRAAAIYPAGCEAIRGDPHEMFFVLVEQTARSPSVVVVRMKPKAVERGRAEWLNALPVWEECVRLNKWPSVGQWIEHDRLKTGVIDVGLPAWAEERNDGE